jgi:hypothetical protein
MGPDQIEREKIETNERMINVWMKKKEEDFKLVF